MRRFLPLGAGAVALALALAPGAAADLRFQAEGGSFSPRSVRVVKDRAAGGKRAVLLVGRGELRKRLSTSALARMAIRARGVPCRGRPRLRVRIDDFLAGTVRVRSRRWRVYLLRAPAKAGLHTIRISLANPRRAGRCRRRLVVDSVRLIAATAPRPPIPAKPSRQAAAQPPTFTNPVWPNGMADPMVLDVGSHHNDYWAYATGGSFPSLHSTDLVHWTDNGGAMPTRPSWAPQTGQYNPWAPSVLEKPGPCPGAASGPCFVMYHVSLNTTLDPDSNCIGVATSPTPAGPFSEHGILDDAAHTRDAQNRPIGCGDDAGYSNIDPAPVVSGGNAYLYLSTRHHCATCSTVDTHLSVVPLSADRLSATGPRVELLRNDQAWEHSVVENPWPVQNGAAWHLLYSGGVFTGQYGMGDASGAAPTGPFTKHPGNPILTDGNGVVSAGGGSVVTGPKGGLWAVYHGRNSAGGARLLRLDPLGFDGGGAADVDGPSTTPRPVP